MANKVIIEERRITAPSQLGGDGLGLCEPVEYIVRDCIIDLSGCSLGEIDEAVGVTWGARARFERCVIRGAGKLVLCASGDADKEGVEARSWVVFTDCILEDFGRRGVEVQSGMFVEMSHCLIQNWGKPDRFSVRNFASWAHHGAQIAAYKCVYRQRFHLRHWLRDLVAHVGQAWNDEGLRGLFRPSTWLPGVTHALRATAGGYVSADYCWAPWWCLLPYDIHPLNATERDVLIARLEDMRVELEAKV